MNATLPAGSPPLAGRRPSLDDRPISTHAHAICWGAVLAGAAGAASLALILLMLGVGLGLSAVSPWASEGMSAPAFGMSTILWLGFTQFAASGLGGYLAGRLRMRWAGVQADEVYFRDTAHGFLSWSVAALVTAGLLGSAVGSIIGAGARTGATLAGTATMAAAPAMANAASATAGTRYFVDSLFRRDVGAPGGATAASAAQLSPALATHMPLTPPPPADEALKIFAHAAGSGALPPEDARHLGQLVAQQTGMAQADAERRVNDSFNRMKAQAEVSSHEARAAADTARKAAARASLWGFVALLIGAFIASFAATLGGRHRDQF